MRFIVPPRNSSVVDHASVCEDEDGCKEYAEEVIYDRDKSEVVLLCPAHAKIFNDSQYKRCEYYECCPNCGCNIPIN